MGGDELSGDSRSTATAATPPRLRKINQQTPAVKRMYAAALSDPAAQTAAVFKGTKDDAGTVDLAEVVESAWTGGGGLESALGVVLEGQGSQPAEAGANEVVGWCVVKPGSGGVADADVLAIHAELFPDWWQIALVVDPASRRHGIYGRREGKLRRLGGKGGEAARSDGTGPEVRATPRAPSQEPSRTRAATPPEAESAEPRSRPERVAEISTWRSRAALVVPMVAGFAGGVVLAILR